MAYYDNNYRIYYLEIRKSRYLQVKKRKLLYGLLYNVYKGCIKAVILFYDSFSFTLVI